MTHEHLWQDVVAHNQAADGLFVYAVQSTGVYCRPSCPSRRPRRDRVEFFPSPGMASAAGYRACRRCRPDDLGSPAEDAMRPMRRACEAIASRPDARWTAGAIARAAGVTPVRLTRAFRRALDMTPREYAAACRRRAFLDRVRAGASVTDAIYDAGYGSFSRVYGGLKLPGMTPATYGRGGDGARIEWATIESTVGRILVASTAKGLCFVAVGKSDRDLEASLREEFPRAEIAASDTARLRSLAGAARAAAEAKAPPASLPIDILGTAFQWRVWRALTAIPAGETRTYGQVAASIGAPAATRAVARACAANPIALVVPCHRVVPANGGEGGYRWGTGVKRHVLNRERG
jgi:AraC family transcriptional regulator of adaptative response/methylated-DNA-[protein]-cysteine methyltransferase